jgi:hypothetical protein
MYTAVRQRMYTFSWHARQNQKYFTELFELAVCIIAFDVFDGSADGRLMDGAWMRWRRAHFLFPFYGTGESIPLDFEFSAHPPLLKRPSLPGKRQVEVSRSDRQVELLSNTHREAIAIFSTTASHYNTTRSVVQD